MVRPNLPHYPRVYTLPDGRGICLTYNDEVNQWFLGYIRAGCANSQLSSCPCYYFINQVLQSESGYWALKENRRISYENEGQGGERLHFLQMRHIYDLCFHREPENGACLIGYSADGSDHCDAEGKQYMDYFLLRYSPPERLQNAYEAMKYTVIFFGIISIGVAAFFCYLVAADTITYYLKKTF